MSKPIALMLAALVVALGAPTAAQAQNAIPMQGTIQAVDCQKGAIVLNAQDGTHILPVASNVRTSVQSAAVSFCALRQYVGSGAVVYVAAVGNQLMAVRVDVLASAPAPVAPPPPAAAPVPAPDYGYSGPYYPYYGGPYCSGPYYGGPYYGPPYCYGAYAGYYPYYPYYYGYGPYYYGPAFGIGIGIGVGPGFRGHGRRFVQSPGFHGGRRGAGAPVFHGGGRRR
jgi:hypothetical protein